MSTIDLPLTNQQLEKKLAKFEITKKNIKNGTHYIINLDEDIGEPRLYREHFDILLNAKPTDIVELIIQSWGGYLDTTVAYVNALLTTKAHTKATMHTAASAVTLIGFACQEIKVFPLSTIMIHNFSASQSGKGSELRAKTAFDEKQFKELCNILYKGILTETEISNLLLDRDMWILGKELETRMKDLEWCAVKKYQ